jgi:hypothetical protein
MILFLKAGIPLILSANSLGMIPASARLTIAYASLSLTFQRERAEAR